MYRFLIYGSYGYTGQLIVEQAVKNGVMPLLGGRDSDKLRDQAERFGLEYFAFEHHDQDSWDHALKDVDLLVNCAGPFTFTIREILPACIRNKVHYSDITGEIDVFEYIHSLHNQAIEAGITLMPGVGFDIVPTDCLAKFLVETQPSATHLELAFDSSSGLSRGTALSLLNRLPKGSSKRVDGRIEEYPTGTIHKTIHYAGKHRFSVGIAWGDVFTSMYTTGIPNTTVYTSMSENTMKWLGRMGKWSWLVKSAPIQALGRRIIRNRIHGPSPEKRSTLKTFLYGKVWNDLGETTEAEMITPESYHLTAQTAIQCAINIVSGNADPGFQTPALAFGAEFILGFKGVERTLVGGSRIKD